MKIKTLVPFIVILALLLGLVAWRKASEAPPAPIATQIGLETLAPEGLTGRDIARVELFSGTEPGEKVVLERADDAWHITSLYNAPVNSATLEGFLDKALGLKGEPRAKADSDARLAEFSLKDDEAFHVQLFKSAAETPAMYILVGKSADFRTVFVRKAGSNQVFVESTNLRREAGVSDAGDTATPKPTKWLQTTLLELDKGKINRIALQYPNKEMVFERREVVAEKPEESPEGEEDNAAIPQEEPAVTYEWTLASGGFSQTFTESELQTLLTKFSMLAVTNVVDPERKADWGFEPPSYKATISRDGEEDVVLFGGRDKPGGDTYVQLEGAEPSLIYQMAKFNFDQIFPQGSKLFALPEWSVEQNSITRIAIQRPDGPVVLLKEADAWRVVEPALNLEVQKTTLDNLVAAACTLKPVDYVDAGRDVGAFDTTITLYTDAGQSRSLTLGQPAMDTDGRYVRLDDSNSVLVISRADMEKLSPPTRDLYSLSVLDVDIGNIERIAVVHAGTDLQLERDANDTNIWQRIVNGNSADTLLNDVEEFVYTLNAFQVDNFLLDRTAESVQAATTITVNQTGKEPVVLQLSAESNRMHEAVISGLPYVFSVKADELTRIVEDMALFIEMPEEQQGEALPETETDVPVDGIADSVPTQDITPPMVNETSTIMFPADATGVQPSEVAPSDGTVIIPENNQ